MPASRSVMSALVRALGDLLHSLKAGPAARQPHHGHRGPRRTLCRRRYRTLRPWLAAPMGFEQRLDQWREFYLAVAGAAAVLLGLVFTPSRSSLRRPWHPGSRSSALAARP
jgi:hypothetical protein